MLTRTQKADQIFNLFAYFSITITMKNSVGMTDDNKIAEPVFIELLNKVYGYSLRDVNIDKSNHVAIDAADDNLGIAVQITSDRSKKKKDDTIAKLESHQLNKKYKHIIFLLLSDRDTSKTYEKEGYKIEIITLTDLAKSIYNKPPKEFEELFNYCMNELGSYNFIQNAGIVFKQTQYSMIDLQADISSFMKINWYFLGDEPTQVEVKQGLTLLRTALQQLNYPSLMVIFKILDYTIKYNNLDHSDLTIMPIANMQAGLTKEQVKVYDTITEALENIQLVYTHDEPTWYYHRPHYAAVFKHEAVDDFNFFLGICRFFKSKDNYDPIELAKMIYEYDFSMIN